MTLSILVLTLCLRDSFRSYIVHVGTDRSISQLTVFLNLKIRAVHIANKSPFRRRRNIYVTDNNRFCHFNLEKIAKFAYFSMAGKIGSHFLDFPGALGTL